MAWPTRTAIASLACLAAACSQAASADFDGYEMVPVDQLPVTRAASLMAIVAGLIESPEQPIGSPFLTLEIKVTINHIRIRYFIMPSLAPLIKLHPDKTRQKKE